MTVSLAAHLTFALTGEDVAVPDSVATPEFEVDLLLGCLAEQGWSAQRVISHAEHTWAQGQPWPHPVEDLGEIGPAQWWAALSMLRAELGLGVQRQPPSKRTELDQDERRLSAELPPHHGPTG